jgi:hypothetical protein
MLLGDTPALAQWHPDIYRQLIRHRPVYTIRLHAIATANNDGSDASPFTATAVQNRIAGINEIFYKAGIEFEFDPDTDFEQIDATVLNKYFTLLEDPADYTDPEVKPPITSEFHAAFRRAIANTHRGKLVLFFSSPDKLVYDEDLGHWILTDAGGGGSSSGTGRWVSMKGNSQAPDLAHEIGHYLHQVHPFVGKIETVADAAARIKKAVDKGLPVGQGLDALDGDRAYVLDTPPDASTTIWNTTFGDGSACSDHITGIYFPVYFPYGTIWYLLQPDRSLVMSYFKGCGFDNRFSPQQITRMRDALENMNRHDLISRKKTGFLRLERRGSATAGSIDDVHLVRIGFRRLVSVTVRDNQMKLIPWEVSPDGNKIVRLQGSAEAGPVTQVAALHTGLGNVLTAVRDSDGNLKLITWKVHADGAIERLHDFTAGPVLSIAAARWDRLHVVTAVRTLTEMKVIAWRVYADGSIHRLADASAPGWYPYMLSVIDVTPTPWGVVTSILNSNNSLEVTGWHVVYDDDEKKWKVIRMSSDGGGFTDIIAATALDYDNLLTTTVRTQAGDQKVIAWYVDYLGGVERGASAISPGNCTRLESERLGVGTLVTACQDASHTGLKMSLFAVGPYGESVDLYDTAHAGGISALSLARAGDDMVVSAIRTNSGTLKLIAWKGKKTIDFNWNFR